MIFNALFPNFRFSVVSNSLWLCALTLLLLELWRPFTFLSDDNLTGALPLMVTIGDSLKAGRSPFIVPYLFGGDYNLLQDPVALWLWNPVVLLLSLLSGTRFSFWMVDLFCAFNLLLCCGAMALLLHQLRQRFALPLSDGLIVGLSWSYTFSSYALLVGASWLMFLANQASLPIIVLGLLHRKTSIGVLLTTWGVMHGFLVGHLSPFLFSTLFLFLFVVIWGIMIRSWKDLLRLFSGSILALIIASPLLWPAFQGYFVSSRQGAFSVLGASLFSIPPGLFIVTLFGGYVAAVPYLIFVSEIVLRLHAFPSCLAAYLFFPALNFKEFVAERFPKLTFLFTGIQTSRQRIERVSNTQIALERSAIVVCLLVILFVWRPYWLGLMLSYLPLFRSLRNPFREIFNFLFLFHFWIALRCRYFNYSSLKLFYSLGAIFFFPFLVLAPRSFTPFEIDRNLIFSGEAYSYWRNVKKHLKQNDVIVPVIDPKIVTHESLTRMPHTLIGSYNYPSLFKVRSITGYTAQGLSSAQGEKPYLWPGLYSPEAVQRLFRKMPNLKALELVSLDPLKIQLVTKDSRITLPLPLSTKSPLASSLANELPNNRLER